MEKKSGLTLRSMALHALFILILIVVAENLYIVAIMSTTYTHSKGIEAIILSGRTQTDNQIEPSKLAGELRTGTLSMGLKVIVLSILKAALFIAGGFYLTLKSGSVLARLETGLSRLAEGGEGITLGSDGPEELRRVTEKFNELSKNLATARDDLVKSSRLSAAGELASFLAHEIKNPLAAASLSADALESRVAGPGGLDALEEIRDSIGRIDGVVRDLLDMTRPPFRETEAVKIDSLLEDSVRMTRRFAESRGVDLEIIPAGPGVTIMVDQGMAGQILVNLILNAVKVTPSGPAESATENERLKQRDECGKENVSGKGRKAKVEIGGALNRLWVRDFGPGYPHGPGLLQADPFVSGFVDGTGLGLAVVSRLAGIMGLSVWIETPSTGGTIFILSAQKSAQTESESMAWKKS